MTEKARSISGARLQLKQARLGTTEPVISYAAIDQIFKGPPPVLVQHYPHFCRRPHATCMITPNVRLYMYLLERFAHLWCDDDTEQGLTDKNAGQQVFPNQCWHREECVVEDLGYTKPMRPV